MGKNIQRRTNLSQVRVGFLASLLVVGALVLTGILAYRYGVRTASQPQVPTILPDDQTDLTAGWKDFTNEEDSYLVEYPPDWRIKEGSTANREYSWTVFSSPNIQHHTTGGVIVGQKVAIRVTLSEFYAGNSQPLGDSDAPTLVSEESVLVDGIPATRRVFAGVLGEAGEVSVTVILWKEKVYSITCHPTRDSRVDVAQVCNLMISTLRFLE